MAISILSVLIALTAVAAERESGLVGYWPLRGECSDHSGMGNHGVNKGVDLSSPDDAVFDGKTAFVSVPNSTSLQFGEGDFTISAWVKCKAGAGYAGDIISKYDPDSRRGINLCISSSSPGYSSVSDVKNVHFGIDNAVESAWIDCGRPSPTNTLISTLITYRGSLYTGIADATDPKLACRVFRYDGGTRWVDCGRVGDDLKTPSVFSIIVHKGQLYVGTGVWDWEKAWSGNAGPTHVYRYEGGTKWHDCGKFGTGYRVLSLASLNGDLYATDDQGFCYRYDGDYNWSESGKIQDSKIYSTMIYQGRLYGGGNITAYRYAEGGTWDTVGKFDVSIVNQIHTMAVYGGDLYAGTWPEGKILRHDGRSSWADCGNVGVSTDQYKINEINDLTVYNGKMYAGVIPQGEVWRYDGGTQSTLMKRLVENPDYIATSLPTWNRVPCLTVFKGRLYAGTSTCQAQPDPNPKVDVGKVFSWEAGRNVSYDDDLGTDWRHVVAIREGRYLQLYIDGRLAGESAEFDPKAFNLSNTKPLLIGFGSSDHFSGSMRELRIYNRALRLTETNRLHQTATPVNITAEERSEWLRWVIPLPKRVSISQARKLPNADISLRLPENAGDIERYAVSLLDELLPTKKQVGSGQFEILVGICDRDGIVDGIKVPEATELENLPNRDQAYCISSVVANKLIVTALDARGVFHGVQTLRSFLEGRLSGDTVTVPIATIVDWPDIAQRGRWGGTFNGLMINDIDADIEWMSSLKLNLIEACVPYRLVPGGKNVADINSAAVEQARLNALRYVPIIPHPDLLGMFSNAYEVLPQIKGRGNAAQSEGRVAPCASSPDYIRFLTDWMLTLAENPGVTDMCGWLTEHPVYCECEECKKIGNQYVAEALAYIKAWRTAREKRPGLGLRILLSQSTYPVNDQILAIIPEDVGVTYYHGALTYDSSRDPMIYPLMEQYAAKGRWLGCYPQINAAWRIVAPWSGAQFVKVRSSEFADKHLQSVAWYAPANNRLYDMNIAAAAEWSWNSPGREVREFIAAWATRSRFRNPNAVAEWAIEMGPASWNLYGSRIPYWFCFDRVQEVFLKRHQAPTWGQDMFRYWQSIADLDRDIAVTENALKIAQDQHLPRLIAETMVIQGYLKMTRELYPLMVCLASQPPISAAERDAVGKGMDRLAQACIQATTALNRWEQPVGVGPGIGADRLRDTIMFSEKTVTDIGAALETLGIQSHFREYLSTGASGGSTKDRDNTMNVGR